MQSLQQLSNAIDSLEKQSLVYTDKLKNEIFSNFTFYKYLDSGYSKPDIKKEPVVKNFDMLIPDSARRLVHQRSSSLASSSIFTSVVTTGEYMNRQRDLRLHKIEWHKKIALSVACLVLFLIGAPLGSIIRKGGLGLPLVVAVVFFMFFYFLNTVGEKFVKENVLTAFSGMWLSTLILIPLGIFLTYKAMHDSQLLNKEFYFRFWRQMKKLTGRSN